MGIQHQPLPYAREALAPIVSGDTIDLHYGKHHKGYVDTLNKLIEGTDYQNLGLDEIVRRSKSEQQTKIFNNAGQIWNHDLYWRSLTPQDTKPEGAFAEQISADFGGADQLVSQLIESGATQFGSGWAWLVWDNGKLAVRSTANADTPMTDGQPCLLVLDVWEHAYYVDYQNRRRDHLEAVVKRIDWKASGERFAQAKAA